jgi:3,2-trans-enoyl-CoA isomerase
MSLVAVTRDQGIAIVKLERGKVNALNPAGVAELRACVADLAVDGGVEAVVVTGHGSFFSFGWDIPELIDYSKEAFTEFVQAFTNLYRELYACPRPVVAALNGHTIAGGCMLATACDHRVMATGRARISLNEITFGASVFRGSVDLLVALTGHRNARRILLTGSMLGAEEALELGLVDQVAEPARVLERALEAAREFARRDAAAFRSIKALLNAPVVQQMEAAEPESIREFVDLWYSEATRAKLAGIRIRD